MATKLSGLENKRETIISDICIVLNQKNDNFNLRTLIEKMNSSDEEKNKLVKVRAKIVDIISELRKVNEQNKVLVDESMGFVDYTLNAIKSMNTKQDNSYQYGGKFKQASNNTSFFDTKQ